MSRASGRRGYPNGGIAPFRVRTCFCDHWCVGVRLLGKFKNAQRILVHRHYVSAVKRNIRFADDKSECLDGIKAIKTAIAKKPPKPVMDRLKRALDSAEQEEFEGDWDECLAAVRQARLPKK